MELAIYLANLEKYNEGALVGKWVDVLDSPDWMEELESIRVGDNSEYEEFCIATYETDLALEIPKCMSLAKLDGIAEAINGIPPYEEDAFKAAVAYWGIDEAPSIISDGDYTFFAGVTDVAALGRKLVSIDYIEVPKSLRPYIDYKAIGKDYRLKADGEFTAYGFICRCI